MNNPIKFLPSQSMEKREFLLQDKINHLAKVNLEKISRSFLNQFVIDINQDRIKFLKKYVYEANH